MPAIVKLSIETLAEAIASLDLEEMRQLQAMVEQKICEKEASYENYRKSGTDFLRSIAGIGSSDAEDISERDEEILQAEIDPIHGWSIKPTQHP